MFLRVVAAFHRARSSGCYPVAMALRVSSSKPFPPVTPRLSLPGRCLSNTSMRASLCRRLGSRWQLPNVWLCHACPLGAGPFGRDRRSALVLPGPDPIRLQQLATSEWATKPRPAMARRSALREGAKRKGWRESSPSGLGEPPRPLSQRRSRVGTRPSRRGSRRAWGPAWRLVQPARSRWPALPRAGRPAGRPKSG